MKLSSKPKRRSTIHYPGKLNEKLKPLITDFAELEWRSETDAVFTERDQSEIDELFDRLGAFVGDPTWRPEYDERFDLLCDHYAIAHDSPDKWRMLTLALAIDHVPGFQEKSGGIRGRKKSIGATLEVALLGRFTELTQTGQSERNAARLIANELERRTGKKISSKAILARVKRFEPVWRDHVTDGNERPDGPP